MRADDMHDDLRSRGSRCAARTLAIGCAALVTTAMFCDAASPAGAANALRVVVGSGAARGTYRPPGARVPCVSTAGGIAASYKFFAVPNARVPGLTMHVRDAKTSSEAQIEVDNPAERAATRGSLELTFGNRGERPVKYLVFAPGGGVLRRTTAASGSTLAFTGRSKDGVSPAATTTRTETEKL